MTNQLYAYPLLAADGSTYATVSSFATREEAEAARARFVNTGGKAGEVRPSPSSR